MSRDGGAFAALVGWDKVASESLGPATAIGASVVSDVVGAVVATSEPSSGKG